MIGRLRGILISKEDGRVLLDVAGVGYIVSCSDRTIANLPVPGSEVILHTDLVVREDLMQLYGFSSLAEREWYQLLTSVQGVGAKAALAILGAIGVSSLARALTLGDIQTVRAAPGIGPKLAQRICNELSEKSALLVGKLGSAGADDAPLVESAAPPAARAPSAEAEVIEFGAGVSAGFEAEAISALVNLGYDRVLAAQTVTSLAGDAGSLNDLITISLRAMAPKG